MTLTLSNVRVRLTVAPPPATPSANAFLQPALTPLADGRGVAYQGSRYASFFNFSL